MDYIQGSVFADFEPPATTDGSYLGSKKNSDATRKHLQMKLEQEVAQINQRLKASKTKVSILLRTGTIQLRATLPLKPGDTHRQGKDKKQYTISLGIPASFDGLKTAEEEANELGKLVARQTFTWSDKYLGTQTKKKSSITFKEFYEQLESIYFSTRKRTLKSETSFMNYKNLFNSRLNIDLSINEASMRKIIQAENSIPTRKGLIRLMRFISKHLDIKVDFKDLVVNYKPQKRDIPTDREIIVCHSLFKTHFENAPRVSKDYRENWRIYQTIYSLLAIYGLRPREVINSPDLEWLISSENKHNTFKVHKSNKTGYREVFPFVSEWIELFDLKNRKNIEKLQLFCNSWNFATELKSRVTRVANVFQKCELKFSPYDLRHACAIRAHMRGLPIKAAADNLGHSVEIHTEVYQRWFGLENRRKVFEQTFNELNEVEKLKDELTKANKRITELETELARSKCHQIM